MEFMREWPLWVQWLAGISGALVSLGIIWRLGVLTLARAMWAAILAAPEIADGIHELGDLIKGDVLGRINAGDTRVFALEAILKEQQSEISRLDFRLNDVDAALSLQRQVTETLGARITAQELALESLSTRRRSSNPGPRGPEGPRGPQGAGPQGVEGPRGPEGPRGLGASGT
jgi:hypothetical protein